MSSQVKFQLNGNPVNNPRELSDLSVVSEWGDEVSEAEVSLSSFSFVREEAEKIQAFIDAYSRFQGMPFDIFVTDGQTDSQVFEGFLDLRTAVKKGCNEFEVEVEKKYGSGWFSGRADAISFEQLYQDGYLTNADFVYVPYVINYIPDGVQVLIISLTLFTMSKELYEAIERFSKAISKAVETIPDIIAGAAVEILKVGKIAAIVLELIFQLAYIVFIIIAIIKLIIDLVNQFFPKLRYHAGIKYKRLFEVGCEYLGLEFESTIYDDPVWGNSVYIPSKDEKGTLSQTGGIGYPRAQDSIYTLGDLIRNERNKYNAKYKITDGVLRFERRDYWEDFANYELPNVVSSKEERDEVFTTNADEFSGLYKINFQTDLEDQNTLDNFRGTNVVISTTLDTVVDPDYDLTQGGTEIEILEARGTRKNELTGIEKSIRGLFRFVDALTGFLGNGTNFASKIDQRVGALNLSNYIISVPKMVIVQGNKLQSNQEQLVNARKLWNEFHFINSFNPINGEHNQYDIFTDVQIPFCFDDFLKLLNNNFFNLKDGATGEMLRLEWFIEDAKAVVNYRIKRLETTNLKTNIYEG